MTDNFGISPGPATAPKTWELVISDLDGTLLDENSRISPENAAAVAFLNQLGVGFTIATGRLDQTARRFIRQLQISLPVIACNGAIIRDCGSGRILRQDNLPAAAACAIMAVMIDERIDFLAYTAESVYYPPGSFRIEDFRRFNSMDSTLPSDRILLLPLDPGSRDPAFASLVKIVATVPDRAVLANIERRLAGQPGLHGVLSADDLLEIVASGTSKGAALRHLAGILGIDLSEIVAFGDHDNDETMLATAGLGIAMANATPAARAASRLITDHHGDSGVATAIFELFRHV